MKKNVSALLCIVAGFVALQVLLPNQSMRLLMASANDKQFVSYDTTSTHFANSTAENPTISAKGHVPSAKLDEKKNHSSEEPPSPVPRLTNYNRTLTLLVPLAGELGNHLSILTSARLMQRYVEKEMPGVRLRMIGEHQDAAKWKHAQRDLQKCFPTFRNFEFEGGAWDASFQSVKHEQESWLGDKKQMLVNISTKEQLAFLAKLLFEQLHNDTHDAPPTHLQSSPHYSIPYLTSPGMVKNKGRGVDDKVFSDIREFFPFDTTACCKVRAEPFEAVWHFRNFLTEGIKKQGDVVFNYAELSPNETVNALFNTSIEHVRQRPKKVAIISRFTKTVRPYLNAFLSRGWEARVIEGQTGVEDFCFAMSASTLVGTSKSSYTRYAGLLGNATLIRQYSVHTKMPAGYRSETTDFIGGK